MRVARTLCLAAASVLAALFLVLVPAAESRVAANLTLVVNFAESGAITVTMNGQPVGTASGAPTLIPAGVYTVLLNGPGDCINLPLFELKGPGVNLQDDMLGGEVDTHSVPLNFLPNSTYTWHSDKNQAAVYSFRTTAEVAGTAQAAPSAPAAASSSAKPSSQDIVGSATLPFRGTLTGSVSAAGRLTVAYKGKSVASLKAGRYRVAVVDRSSTYGFVLQKSRYAPVTITGAAFLGKRSSTVRLSAGRWSFGLRAGKSVYAIAVLG